MGQSVGRPGRVFKFDDQTVWASGGSLSALSEAIIPACYILNGAIARDTDAVIPGAVGFQVWARAGGDTCGAVRTGCRSGTRLEATARRMDLLRVAEGSAHQGQGSVSTLRVAGRNSMGFIGGWRWTRTHARKSHVAMETSVVG